MKGLVCLCLSGWLLAAMGTHPLAGSLEVVQAEVHPDGSTTILFQDGSPPLPYTVERYDGAHPDSPWIQLPYAGLDCTQSARFSVHVPGAVENPGLYRVSVATGSDRPLIVRTEPACGAFNVSTGLATVEVTFDRPMAPVASVAADTTWGASFVTWSADHRTASIHRIAAPALLPANCLVNLRLNAGGEGFEDAEGRALAAYCLSFATAANAVAGPHVVSTYPINGAQDVDPYINTVELHFSEPMLPIGGFTSRNWYPWTMDWSADGRTAYVRTAREPMPAYGAEVMLITMSFRSALNVEMTPYTLNFRTADPPVLRVEPSPAKGFNWPYLLVVPPAVTAPVTLLVETNNTGTWDDNIWRHDAAAQALVTMRSAFASQLGCPLLVPIFPRPQNPPAPEPGGIYIHALDRYSLSDQWSGIDRIDLQLQAMIDDALQRLRQMGHVMDDRIFMMGFSASGAFTSRFCILHPERVKAAAPGSPGGWPTVPVGSWQGTPLRYPMGVQDVQDLTGQPFDLQAFKQIAFYIYVGGMDTNDAFDVRGMTETEKNQVYQFLNFPQDPVLASRWPLAESIYQSVGANATFVIYPGIGHGISPDMWDDIAAFFSSHR